MALWKRAILNHMYYNAATVPEGRPELLEAMWMSVTNHIMDIHEHDGEYAYCDHPPIRLDDEEDGEKAWLEPGSPAAVLLEEVLHSKLLLKDVRRLSPKFQTSSLEAFHSLINRFAPKHTQFGWLGQTTRYYLAGLHFNENSERMQATTLDGQPRYSVRFPKLKKGEYSVRIEKTPSTYAYTEKIMGKLVHEFETNHDGLQRLPTT